MDPGFSEPPVLLTTEQVNVVIETGDYNITNKRILQEIERFEEYLISTPEIGNSSWIFSLSNIIKSINTSSSLIYDELCSIEVSINPNPSSTFQCLTSDFEGGGNNIPSQTTLDLIFGEMYYASEVKKPILKMLALDSNQDTILNNYRLIIATTAPDALKEKISQFLEQETSVELPCNYDDLGRYVESDGLCTWESLGMEIKMPSKKTLQDAFGFEEQGFFVDNKHVCGHDHSENVLEYCYYKRNSSLSSVSDIDSNIDFTSIMNIMPVNWGNWSGDFENEQIISVSEDLQMCSERNYDYFTCSEATDSILLLILASFERSATNPYSFLVNASGDSNLIWVHTTKEELNAKIFSETAYDSVEYAFTENPENNANYYIIYGLLLVIGGALVYFARRIQFGIIQDDISESPESDATSAEIESPTGIEDVTQQAGPKPSSETEGMIGEDGYEWITFPPNSQNYFYRTPESTEWKKWSN